MDNTVHLRSYIRGWTVCGVATAPTSALLRRNANCKKCLDLADRQDGSAVFGRLPRAEK